MDSPLYREYRKPLSRQGGMLRLERKPPADGPETAYGYPVKSAKDLGLDDYFKGRPDVAGMAWGGGENGSDPSEPRTVVYNPYSKHMSDPIKRDALFKVEAARHLMATNPVPKFRISPALQKWRESSFQKGDPYRENDDHFRETVISRMLVGDTGEKGDMPFDPELDSVVKSFSEKLKPSSQQKPLRSLERRKDWWNPTP